MPLFRRRTQADRLARARRPAGTREVEAGLTTLLDELAIPARREADGWVVDLEDATLLCRWLEDVGVLGGLVEVGVGDEPAELLRRNLDPVLPSSALGSEEEPDSAGLWFALPLTVFERDAVLLALEGMAGLTGAEALGGRLRRARVAPGGGEQAEQAAEARARAAFTDALAELGLPAAERHDTPGAWRVEVDRGIVEAVLRDAGDVLLLMHELEYDGGDEDPDVLRWLLEISDTTGARLGLVPLAGEPALFAAAALPAPGLGTDAVAWGFEQVLRLAEYYDRSTA